LFYLKGSDQVCLHLFTKLSFSRESENLPSQSTKFPVHLTLFLIFFGSLTVFYHTSLLIEISKSVLVLG
jgi:hypothetical protein